MPKVKSVSGAKKRFRKTASGKFKLNHCNKSHILTKKTTKRLRKLRKGLIADKTNEGALRRMLPYA
jgi:large subunit ribosomal protein L35